MYNGIGLRTPRGSGTNGYVQRNLACVIKKKQNVDFRSEKNLEKIDVKKTANLEILEHEKKRIIESKCLELQIKLEEENCSENKIKEEVEKLRKNLENNLKTEMSLKKNETHLLALQKEKEMKRLKEAFNIREDHVEGESFDKFSREKKKEERKKSNDSISSEKSQKIDLKDNRYKRNYRPHEHYNKKVDGDKKKSNSSSGSSSGSENEDKHVKRKKESKY